LSAKRENVTANCYSLSRNKGNPIEFTKYNLKDEFPENPISDEAIKMADDEVIIDLGL
jgi:hypothetical protein